MKKLNRAARRRAMIRTSEHTRAIESLTRPGTITATRTRPVGVMMLKGYYHAAPLPDGRAL